MNKNIINYNKVNELVKNIELTREEILCNIDKLQQQIEILSENYNDDFSRKIYDLIINTKLVSLKKNCEKLMFMKEIFLNVNVAYQSYDNKMSSKLIDNYVE